MGKFDCLSLISDLRFLALEQHECNIVGYSGVELACGRYCGMECSPTKGSWVSNVSTKATFIKVRVAFASITTYHAAYNLSLIERCK